MRIVLLVLIALCAAACATSKPQSGATTSAPPAVPDTVVIALRITGEGVAATRPAPAMQPTLIVDAQPGQPFAGSTRIADHTIAVSGSLQDLRDGRYRISIQYTREGPMHHQAVKSTLELTRGQEFALAGFAGDPKEQRVVVILQ